MVYAGGRPLWQLSIAFHAAGQPAPVLRWSPTRHRQIEHARDMILLNLGSSEPLIEDLQAPLEVTRQWRKPLSFEEINQMTPTPEVRARPGRA